MKTRDEKSQREKKSRRVEGKKQTKKNQKKKIQVRKMLGTSRCIVFFKMIRNDVWVGRVEK